MPKVAINSQQLKKGRRRVAPSFPGDAATRDAVGYAKFLAKVAAIDAANAHKITDEDRIACEDAEELVERALNDPNPTFIEWESEGKYRLVGMIIRDHRDKKQWTKTALAKASGVTPARIARIEKGRFSEKDADLPRIAAALEMDLRRYF